ncbi:hypothetical protein [Streptomyces sp. NBC_01618]|uniref:hypothetical protein n=1 Tax=Streptomyces sp. NBC_01618 TaxID=2975900 RepID=UPI00386987AE|nr:hypothetical protein OH735_35810 [Streptomyces sp. NBC_01618]
MSNRAGAATPRVIVVRNLGASACGLSFFPLVSLGNSHSEDRSKDVEPLIPSGLGGAPAYPVRAGKTAYAVIDLDPSGATTGTVAGIDELTCRPTTLTCQTRKRSTSRSAPARRYSS